MTESQLVINTFKYVGNKILFTAFKLFSKNLLKSHFPLKKDQIEIKFERIPRIYKSGNSSSIIFPLRISNLSAYHKLNLQAFECEIWIWQRRLMTLKKNKLIKLEPLKLNTQLSMDEDITSSMAEKADELFGDNAIAEVTFKLTCTVSTVSETKSFVYNITSEMWLIKA